MKLSLKNIKYMKENSQETFCFNAQMCINGKPAFIVSNAGHGGSTDVHPIGKTPEQIKASWALIKSVEEYAKSLPEKTVQFDDEPFTFEQTLDTLAGDLLVKHLNAKELKKAMGKKIMMIVGDTIFELKLKPGHTATPDMVNWAKAKYPQAIILNGLPFDEAVEKYTELSG